MDTKTRAIIARTRPFEDRMEILVEDQSTRDIIDAMMMKHKETRKDYDRICDLFDAPSAEEIGYNIWKYLKGEIRYEVETEEMQTVRTPGALVMTREVWGADCKNYSLFTGGVLDGLNRRGAGIPWCYRFASYKLLKPEPYHVFVVMYPGSQDEIWIDAVLSGYDQKKYPSHYKDRKVMAIASISGVRQDYVPFRAQIGQDDTDDFTYDEGQDPTDGTSSVADQGSGFDLSTSAGAGLATQANPSLSDTSSTITNPGTTLTSADAVDPDDTNQFIYNPNTGEYEATDQSGALLTSGSAASSSSSNPLTNILNALTGKSSSSGGSSGSGSGSSGTQKSTSPAGSTVNVTTPATSGNMTTYVIIGAVALVAIILLTRKN
jgi:hypothetical protein